MAFTFKESLAYFWQQIANQFVRKESGKSLSTNDYTTEDKLKVGNMPEADNIVTKIIAGDGLEIKDSVQTGDVTLEVKVGSGLRISGGAIAHPQIPEVPNEEWYGEFTGQGTRYLNFGDSFEALAIKYNNTGHIDETYVTQVVLPDKPLDTGATSVAMSGNGNAVTDASYDELTRKITLTKGATYTPTSRTINGKALSTNISLTAADVSAVPTTRTVNNKALSGDITLTASDLKTVILPEEKVVGDAATPIYINNHGEAVACSTLAAASAGKDGAGNIIADTYLKLSGGTVTGEVKSSATVNTSSAAFRNIKVLAPGTEVIAGTTAIPTGEIWVRYEE